MSDVGKKDSNAVKLICINTLPPPVRAPKVKIVEDRPSAHPASPATTEAPAEEIAPEESEQDIPVPDIKEKEKEVNVPSPGPVRSKGRKGSAYPMHSYNYPMVSSSPYRDEDGRKYTGTEAI